MQIESSEAFSDCLAGRLNSAVSSANGPQFALMLSLVYEAQQTKRESHQNTPLDSVDRGYASIPIHLNQVLGLALQAANSAAFNLVNALYSERLLAAPADDVRKEQKSDYPPELDRRGKPQSMLESINASKSFANRLSAA